MVVTYEISKKRKNKIKKLEKIIEENKEELLNPGNLKPVLASRDMERAGTYPYYIYGTISEKDCRILVAKVIDAYWWYYASEVKSYLIDSPELTISLYSVNLDRQEINKLSEIITPESEMKRLSLPVIKYSEEERKYYFGFKDIEPILEIKEKSFGVKGVKIGFIGKEGKVIKEYLF